MGDYWLTCPLPHMLSRSLRVTAFSRSSLRYFSTPSNKANLLKGAPLVNSNNEKVSRQDLFEDKKVVLFGVPGAFTPVCSNKHVPSYLSQAAALKEKGVDHILCVAVNDPFVMKAWAESVKANLDDITFIADFNGALVKELGVEIDLSAANLGNPRSKRFAMIVDDGKVIKQFVEVSPGDFDQSSADNILQQLEEKGEKVDSDSE